MTDSHPGNALRDEGIWLGDVRGSQEVPVSRAGRARRQETYVLDVFVAVTRGGPRVKDAEDRAFALAGELEDVVADDLALGQAQPFWATLGVWEESTFWDEQRQGWGCTIRIELNVNARLL